jgi:hypothetical protein
MEVDVQLQASAAFPQQRKPPVPIGKDAGLAPEAVGKRDDKCSIPYPMTLVRAVLTHPFTAVQKITSRRHF